MKRILLISIIALMTINSFSQVKYIVPETVETDMWNGTGWDNLSFVTYTFNGNCLPTTILSQFRVLGVLENQTYSTLTYTYNPLYIIHINQLWNTGTMSWDNFQRVEHTYNANDDIIETITYDWVTGAWVLKSRVVYTYTAPTLFDTVTTQMWDSINSEWDNTEQEIYTYTGTNKEDVVTTYEWNGGTSSWDVKSRYTNTYNASDLVESTEYDDWDGAQWVHDFLLEYTYDGNGFAIEEVDSDWETSAYVMDSRRLFTNNTEGHPTTIISQSYLLGSWVNASRITQTYPSCASLSVKEDNFANMELYPNPVRNTFKIEGFQQTIDVVEIYSLDGRSVKRIVNHHPENAIEMSSLKTGMYIIKLHQNDQVTTRKLIKR